MLINQKVLQNVFQKVFPFLHGYLFHCRFYIRHSDDIRGFGIFAAKDLSSNIIVSEYTGINHYMKKCSKNYSKSVPKKCSQKVFQKFERIVK